MWSSESIRASNREKIIYDLVASIPNIYYKDIPEEETIIVDKNRFWTTETNVSILKTYIDSDIKIIVLTRPLVEIIKSFAKLSKKNGTNLDASIYLPALKRSLKGLECAKKNNENNTFLFIEYKEIVEETQKVIEKIYDFCGWEAFTHSFEDIKMKNPENDEVYEIPGLHTIRTKIDIEENDVELTQEMLDLVNSLKEEYKVD
jgi:sulfotransferase